MLLLPRPAPHLPRTVAALQAAGLADILPLALSHPESLLVTLPPQATALILTSPFAIQPGLPHLPTYCVGSHTAQATREANLPVIYVGDNDGASMAEDLASHPTQHFIHLHGDHAGMEWHATLQQAGHTVTPLLAYQTNRISALPPEILPILGSSNPHILIPLFSAGSASHLANLFKHANIPVIGTAIALSPAVAQAATAWPRVVTAPEPTLESMVQTLIRITNNE